MDVQLVAEPFVDVCEPNDVLDQGNYVGWSFSITCDELTFGGRRYSDEDQAWLLTWGQDGSQQPFRTDEVPYDDARFGAAVQALIGMTGVSQVRLSVAGGAVVDLRRLGLARPRAGLTPPELVAGALDLDASWAPWGDPGPATPQRVAAVRRGVRLGRVSAPDAERLTREGRVPDQVWRWLELAVQDP